MAIPLLIAGGVAAAGAIAKGAAAAAGAGKNRRQPGAFYDPDGKRGTGYDANASNWGGQPGGRQQYEQNLHNSQMGVEGRQGPQVNYQQADWDRMQSGLARNGQNLAAHTLLNRGLGNTPTIASQQAQIDTQRAIGAANAGQASARTAGGIALAQQNAQNAQANAISNISGQAQVNSGQEMLNNLNSASGAYGAMRSGDFQAQQNAAQQAQVQAQLDANARAQNDQRAMQYEQLKFGANAAELNSKMQNQGILAGSYNNKESLGQQTAQANANREGQQVDSIINGISNTAGMAAGGGGGGMGSDERMKIGYRASGGPVLAGKPYVVGERGPELVIPSASGTVVPNHMLRKGGRAPSTTEMLDDRARQAELTAPADQGGPSLDSMLDDRARQTSAPSEDTIGREALHTGIENQIVRDRDPMTQRERDQAMIEQWERSTGQTAQQARDEVRTSDNKAEMAKTNARLGVGGKEKPWYMTDVQGLSMTGNAPTQSVSSLNGRSVWAGGNTFESDDRAKLAAAWDAGRKSAGDDLQRYQSMTPEELQQASNKDRLAESLRAARRDTWDAALMSAQDKIDAEEVSPEPEFVAPPIATTLPPKREPRPATMQRNMAPPMRQRQMSSDERTKNVDRSPIAGANRAMKGEPYTYKEDHIPMHEQPGQPHFGFMAQNLEQNPISATAVEEGPDGMKRVDRDRMMQVMASGIADLQRQQDEMRSTLAKGGRKSKAA